MVNDRADIAALCECGRRARGAGGFGRGGSAAICGAGRWVGVSTHNLEQFREAIETSADYMAVGPVFRDEQRRRIRTRWWAWNSWRARGS